MTWDLFWEIARQYGLPLAGAVALILALVSGRLRLPREVERSDADTAQLRRDYDARLDEMTRDRDYYRDMTMQLLHRYGNEVETSESAIRTATRVIGRRP